MKHIIKSNIMHKIPDISALISENALFLDLETTGFSAARSRLYLIGTAYLERTELITEQFFAESPKEEPQLLLSLDKLLQRFDTVVTFYGTHFDLPFLEKCQKRLKMDMVSHNNNYVDLYKRAHAYRHIFGLENCRQKTLEAFLGMERKDRYSGGELIQVYQDYVKQPADTLLSLLLQHNEEDLLGMIYLLRLSAFDDFFSGSFVPEDAQLNTYRRLNGSMGKELQISCRLEHALPAAVSCKNDCFYLRALKNDAHFCIPLLESTLKYFYPNYKDYYYLPQEDTAIHKSVAAYVEPAHRQKAKASNCYIKKAGAFLPQYEEVFTPALYTEYKAPRSYFEWKDAFAKDPVRLKPYCIHILDILKRGT